MKIGFLDSGLGGVLVLRAVVAALPQYDYEYYGDTANLPYGDKTEDEIFQLVKVGAEYLYEKGCVLVILACNTASAETLRRLQDEWLPHAYPDRKLLGVIVPMVEEVVKAGMSDVLLIATKRTIDSGKFRLEFDKMGGKDIMLEGVATPTLVPLIEAGKGDEALAVVEELLYKRKKLPEAVILGCTHYSLLVSALREKFHSVKFFTQPDIIPAKVADYLARHREVTSRLTTEKHRTIHLTAHRDDYDNLLEGLLQ